MFVSTGILLIATCWGCIDALRKKLALNVPSTFLAGALMVGQIPIYVAWILSTSNHFWSPNWLIAGGINVAFNVISLICFLRALRLAPLSQTIPLLSFTPVWSTIIALLALNEIPTQSDLMGTALIVLGTLGLHTRFKWTTWQTILNPGTANMLVVTLLWSSALTLDKIALDYTTPALHALLTVMSSTVGLLGLAHYDGQIRKGWVAIGQTKWTLLATVVIYAIATALQLWAVQIVLVGIVESVKRGVGMLLSLINGAIFFEERIHVEHIFGVFTMVAGVVVLLGYGLG